MTREERVTALLAALDLKRYLIVRKAEVEAELDVVEAVLALRGEEIAR